MSSYDDYVKKAQQQYDPQYNNQVNQLKSSLASAMAGYDKQTADTNTNYDASVKNQNLGTQTAEKNYDTNTLGRGLGRSTIYTSGIAGLDDKNTRLVGSINTDRNAKLGEIGLNRTNTNNTYNANLTQLGIDRDNQIATLARQLQQTDWDNAYKQQQLELQRQSEARLAASKAASTGQGISESSGNSYYNAGKADIDKITSTAGWASPDTVAQLVNLANSYASKSDPYNQALARYAAQRAQNVQVTVTHNQKVRPELQY